MRSFLCLIGGVLAMIQVCAQSPVHIATSVENDLLSLFEANQLSYKRHTDAETAIEKAPRGSLVLLMADHYPAKRLSLSDRAFAKARQKKLNIYIEYPASFTGIDLSAKDKHIRLERAIVNTSAIPALDSLDLLAVNDHQFIPVKVNQAYLLLGTVAGYDRADYGISDIESYPLLFQKENFIVATTKLSDVLRSRFGPADSWKAVWSFILKQMGYQGEPFSKWEKELGPAYAKSVPLPEGAYRRGIFDGSEWFYRSRLFIHPDWQSVFEQRTSKDGIKVVYPAIPAGSPVGDGSLGILEGHASYLNADGTQPVRWWLRADCQAEVAFALSSAAKELSQTRYGETAERLLDHLFNVSNLRAGERGDPKSPSFGLLGWATTDPDAYYGDDNARAIIALLGTAGNLEKDRWDEYIVECILGNFRTAGKNGFRGPWFRDAAMQKTTWQALGEREIINVHPHYESWLWACYVWLYDKTGHRPLLEKAKSAISMTMANEENWKWTNGIQQEYARMILPLAWLVRVEDRPEHRAWLDRVVGKLLADLQPEGGIAEKFGKEGLGRYGKISSNAAYGLKEAPLISDYGNPVTDLLYTLNFAFFTLNEAAAATKNPVYAEATKRIADFMLRVQVNSSRHPELHGAWFRAFDYRHWDYWASNADSGWGPWGTLTGWTQSWILNGLIYQQHQKNFWDQSAHFYHRETFKKMASEKIEAMLEKR